MSARFYINCPLQPGPIDLTGAEAHHLAAVCRLRPGDALCLFNGDGREYPARVVDVQRRFVSLEVLAVADPARELPFSLTAVAPLPKGDRAQFLIEKLTELGVSNYVPLSTERSVVQPRDTRIEKLQRYVIEASKQCGRNALMRIEPLVNWESYCCRDDLPQMRIVAQPSGRCPSEVQPGGHGDGAAVVAVGPEGGFTAAEVAAANAAGWISVDLGPRILRIETAALVLVSWMSL